MKRISTLILQACMGLCLCLCLTLGTSAQAQALEVTAGGQMVFQFGIRDNYGGVDGAFQDGDADHFFARQRARIQVDFIASEHLRGVLQFQIGTLNWGSAAEGGQLDTNSAEPKTRQAYINWQPPDTGLNLRMGLQLLAMPSAVAGNPILDTTVAAVVANYALSENVSLGAFWARPYNNSDPATKYKNNSMDLFSLLADFNYDQFRVQPYVLYGRVGEDSGWAGVPDGNGTRDRYSNLYMGGLALSLQPTDKLSVNFDGMYGYLKNESEDMSRGIEKAQGWLVVLGVDYDLSFGVLGGIAWYGSGDDEDDVKDIGRGKGKLGNMPMISQGNSGFYPTRLGYAGSWAMGDDTLISGTGTGTWGAGLHFKDFSFIENLSHTARAFYIQGTNDKDVPLQEAYFSDALYLTTKDKGFELNFDSTLDLGDGLKVIMELGYIHMDWDNDIVYRAKYREDNIWNAQLTFDYRF